MDDTNESDTTDRRRGGLRPLASQARSARPSAGVGRVVAGGEWDALVPSGNQSERAVAPVAPALASNLTGSDRFPYGGGTGNQSFSGVPPTGSPGAGTGGNQEPVTARAGASTRHLPFTLTKPLPPTTNSEHAGAERPGCLRPDGSPRSSWYPSPLAAIVAGLVDGSIDRPRPTVGRLADGSHWLYARAVNGLAGESGCGKTWTALAAVAAELADGNSAVYIDLEDSAYGVLGRLIDLGVDPAVIADASRFAYVHPDEAFRDDVRTDLWDLLALMKPTLVVLDSTGESMSLEGVDPNSDDGVAAWFQRVATAIARRGPAVLLLDHLPKSDSSAASPIGSQRKRAAISGVQMIQTVSRGMNFAKGRAGEAQLRCTKDRHGHFVTGEKVLSLTVNPDPLRGDGGVDLLLALAVEEFAPTRHMAEISAHLEQAVGPESTNAIVKAVSGKRETLLKALEVLRESGYIDAASAARNSTEYVHVKPYRLGDPYSVPDDESDGCGHQWHDDGRCNPGWCHPQHHGCCNQETPCEHVVRGEV